MKHKPSVMKHMLRILSSHPSMIIPIFTARLFGFALVIIITLPLIRAHTQGLSSLELITITRSLGINLHSPTIYLIILFLFFINNIISTLLYSLSLISLLDYFRGKAFSLNKGLRGIFKHFIAILYWCAVNKSIGILLRLWDEIAGFIDHPRIKSYNWQEGTCLSLLFILDENCSPRKAVEKSKALVHEKTGVKLKFSTKLSKIFLSLGLCATLPLLIGLVLYTSKSILIGGLITTLCFFVISSISTVFNLIIISVFYEHWAHKKLVAGFDEKMLRGIVDFC